MSKHDEVNGLGTEGLDDKQRSLQAAQSPPPDTLPHDLLMETIASMEGEIGIDYSLYDFGEKLLQALTSTIQAVKPKKLKAVTKDGLNIGDNAAYNHGIDDTVAAILAKIGGSNE